MWPGPGSRLMQFRSPRGCPAKPRGRLAKLVPRGLGLRVLRLLAVRFNTRGEGGGRGDYALSCPRGVMDKASDPRGTAHIPAMLHLVGMVGPRPSDPGSGPGGGICHTAVIPNARPPGTEAGTTWLLQLCTIMCSTNLVLPGASRTRPGNHTTRPTSQPTDATQLPRPGVEPGTSRYSL